MKSYLNSRWLSFRISGRNTGAYSFQNAFFYLQFADDPAMYSNVYTANAAMRASLITQRKTRRFVFFFQCKLIHLLVIITVFFDIDELNCIHKSSAQNIFVNRMLSLKLEIILCGSLSLAGVLLMYQLMLASYIITG